MTLVSDHRSVLVPVGSCVAQNVVGMLCMGNYYVPNYVHIMCYVQTRNSDH
mgnify:CR=1 FL=1